MAKLSVEVKNGDAVNVKVNYEGEITAEFLMKVFEGFKEIEHKSSTGNKEEKKAFEN